MTDYTYRAFISYSWADAKWGKWLQHAIETYHTPKSLIEKHAGTREIPARLTPLFKDREEQAAGASIGASIEAALADSEYLIVICSPNSAQSQWVNHEIAWFKTNRNPDKILALIVAGEPGCDKEECFPKALTHKIAPDLTVMDQPDEAPLAADARDIGDGKRLAKLKLVAAMLGVGLDELLQRDDRRRLVRTRIIAGASLALALVMSGLTWFAVEQRNEAERRQAIVEGEFEFMLTDLREELEPVGRLDALDLVGQRVLTYYTEQDPHSLSADSLGRRARALLLVGEITNIRGNSEEALKAFTQAAATTQEQLARDSDNEQRIFDHAQSVFWVGAIAYGRGELDNAEAQFRQYKRLADRLIELNPDKLEWQMESSYAETNLGVMFHEQERYADAEPAFKNAVERIAAVAESEEHDPARQIELGMALNWHGITSERLGKVRDSLSRHRREVAIYEEILDRDPTNTQAKNRLSIALQFVGGREYSLGNLANGIGAYDSSLQLNSELQELEPENTEWQETEVHGRLSQARQLMLTGRYQESKKMLRGAASRLSAMIESDPENEVWATELRFIEARVASELALAADNLPDATHSVARMLEILDGSSHTLEAEQVANAHLLSGDLYKRRGLTDEARSAWSRGLEVSAEKSGVETTRFILLKRLGEEQQAEQLATILDRRGIRHPAYLAALSQD